MSGLAIDQKAALLELRKKQTAQENPIEEQKATPESTEESVKPTAQEIPKDQPKEVAKPTEEPEKVIEQEAKSWDAEEVKNEPPKIDFNFSELGSALELGEVKTREEFIAKASELKSKLKEYQDKPLSGIPDEFKEVIEFSKTGDWKDLLASQLVDYSKFDPEEEFEIEFYKDAEKDPKFQSDGKFNEELANQAFDTIPEYLRKQYGKDILYRKMQNQSLHRQALQQKAQQKKIEAEKSLVQASKNLQELLPFENYGIKFEPKHSSQIYEGISNSSLTKKHLGASYDSLVREGFDMKAVARTIAAAEYAERMVKFKAENAKSSAERSLLEKTQNIQLDTPGSRVNPDSPDQKVLSPAEKLAKHFTAQRKGL